MCLWRRSNTCVSRVEYIVVIVIFSFFLWRVDCFLNIYINLAHTLIIITSTQLIGSIGPNLPTFVGIQIKPLLLIYYTIIPSPYYTWEWYMAAELRSEFEDPSCYGVDHTCARCLLLKNHRVNNNQYNRWKAEGWRIQK